MSDKSLITGVKGAQPDNLSTSNFGIGLPSTHIVFDLENFLFQ